MQTFRTMILHFFIAIFMTLLNKNVTQAKDENGYYHQYQKYPLNGLAADLGNKIRNTSEMI